MRITTERLLLRDFVIDDVRDLLTYQRDPLYLRYYPEDWANRSDDEIRAFLQTQIDHQAESPRRQFQLAITLPGSDRLIGNCGIRRTAGNEWVAEIGYELAPEHWGRGYATEAARALIAFGFRALGVHRISASVVADNVGSVRVVEKAGQRLEGRLRETQRFRGRWWDTLLFGVLADEWEAGRAGE